MKNKTFLKLTSAIALAACFSAPAQAALITGTIDFSGGVSLTGAAGTPGTLAYFQSATGLAFNGAQVDPFTPRTGDYASVTTPQNVTFSDFTYAPTLQPGGINPLWTFTQGSTYSFSLSTVSSLVTLVAGTPTLSLSGTGTLNITGFDPTPGTWSLTTQANRANSIISFSSSSASVPEPMSLSLLGIGIATLAAKRKSKVVEI